MVSSAYLKQLRSWAATQNDDLAKELLADGDVDDDTVLYLVDELRAPKEVKQEAIVITDFQSVLQYARGALGADHVLVRMISRSKSKDLTARSLSVAVRKLQKLCPMLRLLQPSSTPSRRPLYDQSNTFTATKSPVKVKKEPCYPSPSPCGDGHLMDADLSLSIQEAKAEANRKRQRTGKQSQSDPGQDNGAAHSFRQSSPAVKRVFHSNLQFELQKMRKEDPGFVLSDSFGKDVLMRTARAMALAQTFGPYENEFLRGTSAQDKLNYSGRVQIVTRLCSRLRGSWIARQKMTLAGCRTEGNLSDAVTILEKRWRRYANNRQSTVTKAEKKNERRGAAKLRALFNIAEFGPPKCGTYIMLCNGAPVKVEEVKASDKKPPLLKLRHIDGDIVEAQDPDCELGLVEKSKWIPAALFQSACFQNVTASDQIMNAEQWATQVKQSSAAQAHAVRTVGTSAPDLKVMQQEMKTLSFPEIQSQGSRFSSEEEVAKKAKLVAASLCAASVAKASRLNGVNRLTALGAIRDNNESKNKRKRDVQKQLPDKRARLEKQPSTTPDKTSTKIPTDPRQQSWSRATRQHERKFGCRPPPPPPSLIPPVVPNHPPTTPTAPSPTNTASSSTTAIDDLASIAAENSSSSTGNFSEEKNHNAGDNDDDDDEDDDDEFDDDEDDEDTQLQELPEDLVQEPEQEQEQQRDLGDAILGGPVDDLLTTSYITITPGLEELLRRQPDLSCDPAKSVEEIIFPDPGFNRDIVMTSSLALKKSTSLLHQQNLSDIVIKVNKGFRANDLSSTHASEREWESFIQSMFSCVDAMSKSSGRIWLVDEPNSHTKLCNFDRPGAILCAYLMQIHNVTPTLAIREVGGLIYRSGKYFDERCHFTRPLQAFGLGCHDYSSSKHLRAQPLTPQAMAALKPTGMDVAMAAETQDSQQEPIVAPAGFDQGMLEAMVAMPREPDRRKLGRESGIQGEREKSAESVVSGQSGRCPRASKEDLQHPMKKGGSSSSKAALAEIWKVGAKVTINWHEQWGYWWQGLVLEAKSQILTVEFSDGDVQHYKKQELLRQYKDHPTRYWRSGHVASDLNLPLPALRAAHIAAKDAAKFAMRVAEAALDRATEYGEGVLCEVPCECYKGDWVLAIVTHAGKQKTLVAVVKNGRTHPPTEANTHKIRRTRKSPRQLSQLSIPAHEFPAEMSPLKKNKIHVCEEPGCTALHRSFSHLCADARRELMVRVCWYVSMCLCVHLCVYVRVFHAPPTPPPLLS